MKFVLSPQPLTYLRYYATCPGYHDLDSRQKKRLERQLWLFLEVLHVCMELVRFLDDGF